jgi:amino acid transporter
MTLITYFLICAGPYGLEDTVGGAGPFLTLVAVVIVPILLSFPLSLFCAEMGTIFPQTGSTIMWALDIVHGYEKFL